MSPARKVAFEVLKHTAGGGHAADLLLSRGRALSERDAALASEIVFGVLRRMRQLDYLIATSAGVDPEKLDLPVRIALQMGFYQIAFLDRVPPHAAATESVELVKRARKRSAAGLVNAVLRRAGRNLPPWPDKPTELSLPNFLYERWVSHFGAEKAEALGRAFLVKPQTYVRVPKGQTPPADLEPTSIEGCYRVRGRRPEEFRVQDISSQCVVPMLELEPGLLLLDVCAAPGNKTAQALEYGVRTVACDSHLGRLRHLLADAPKLAADATRPLPFRRVFDRILLDAPCSGTGTLARNPEIRWRLREEDFGRFAQRQKAMLANALECLKPGGLLVYSTCSLEPEENEEVVRAVAPSMLVREMRRTPGVEPGDGFYIAVLASR